MTKNYDIVIIGAGIFGSAIFHELSKLRAGKILLIEKNRIASGTTGQSGGLIRKFYNPPHLWKFAASSFDYYQNFTSLVGSSCGFKQIGCYYLLPDITDTTQQQYQTLNTNNYTIENFTKQLPGINNELCDNVFYEPSAGCIDTHLTTNAWIASGLNSTSHLLENTFVEELIIHNENIKGVKINNEIIYAGQVILATGAWSISLIANINSNISITKKAFQYHRIHQVSSPIKSAVLDMRNQFYLVPGNSEITTGFLNNDITLDSDATISEIDINQKDLLQKSLVSRFSWFNKIENLTDHIAIDAFSENTDNLFGNIAPITGIYHVAMGNGGGIKIAPAVANHIARYIMNRF